MSNNCFGNYTTTGAAGPSVCNPAPVCCTPAEMKRSMPICNTCLSARVSRFRRGSAWVP